MSHYSVCVAIPKEKMEGKEISGWAIESILDEILEPYYENSDKGEYLEFTDKTEAAQTDYESDTSTVIKYPDGSIHGCYDPDFRKRFIVRDGKILEKINDESDKGIETDRSRQMELLPDYPVKNRYSFREYCEDYCGYAEHDGRWGYWHNRNAKWDWYSIGGRFGGAFLVDNELDKCCTCEELANGERFMKVNAACKGDIRWSEYMEQMRELKKLYYEKLRTIFATGNNDELGPLTAITPEGIMDFDELVYKKGESLEEFMYRNGTAPDDRYLLNCFAFVDKDGAWHGSGDMGWFGMSSNNKDERSWHEEVQAFLSELDDEDFLVMVDCHI